MTIRHDHTGTERVLCTEMDFTKPAELRTSEQVLIGSPVTVNGRDGVLTAACAPHEPGATGLVFVTFPDEAPGEDGLAVQHEFLPGELGLRWT